MRVLLDTNIIIHREAAAIARPEIGSLFKWLDDLGYTKCVHPITVDEISAHKNPKIVNTFRAKITSYTILKTTAPDQPGIEIIRTTVDKNSNDLNDTTLLNELVAGRVAMLITEDRGIHRKAKRLGVAVHVFTIDGFLEKVAAENPSLAEYKVLAVKTAYFGNINIEDQFFDSFRRDYPEFNSWFNRKSDEVAYVCADNGGEIAAFLYVKVEGRNENYGDISPVMLSKKRLKIGTLKVESNGFKIGERFIKIIFDNAIKFEVEEIYVTVFDRGDNKLRLISLLEDWGFIRHGVKRVHGAEELVYIRSCAPEELAQHHLARLTYPYAKPDTNKWILPIYPDYHTELFPDSILNTESPSDYIENTPNRYAISKVYISRSINRDINPGDLIVFYRTKSGSGPAKYTSVATTIGVVQRVDLDIRDLDHFIQLCRRRSVFGDEKLAEHWNYDQANRPFVVNFLYLYSFPKRMNLDALQDAGVIESAPRGFEPLTNDQFHTLLGGSNVDRRLTLD